MFEQTCPDPPLATEGKAHRVRVERVLTASGKRVTQVANLSLFRPWDLRGPGAQASAERVRPFIRRFQDDAMAFPTDQDLVLSGEPTILREPDCLTSTILEQLRAGGFHGVSLDSRLYGDQGAAVERSCSCR